MNLQPLQLVMIASITSHLMVAAMFLAVRKMLPTRAATYWIACSLSIATSYMLAILFHSQPETIIGDIVFYALNMLSVSGMYMGCREFLGHHVQPQVVGKALATILGSSMLCMFVDAKIIADILFSIYCSYLTFSLSIYFYHNQRESADHRLSKAMSVLFVALSLHWLDYPFLHTIDWFAPIGFLIAMALSIAISLLFSAQVLSRFQTQLLLSEQRALHEANHDALTGLCNRAYLEQQFREHVRQTKKKNTRASSFAVIYIDLDGFKTINDNHGHQAGDAVLKSVSQRIKLEFGHRYIIARVGGDEFVLLSPAFYPENIKAQNQLTQELLAIIEQPISHQQNQLNVSASIGISFFPLHGQSLAMLLEKADTAMYRVKRERRLQKREQDKNHPAETDQQKTVAGATPATNRLSSPETDSPLLYYTQPTHTIRQTRKSTV